MFNFILVTFETPVSYPSFKISIMFQIKELILFVYIYY